MPLAPRAGFFASADPLPQVLLVPISSCCDVLNDVDFCETLTGVSAGCLSIAEDTCEAEDRVERLESFRGEQDRRSESFNVKGQVDEEVKFWLADKNTGGALCRQGEEILNCLT